MDLKDLNAGMKLAQGWNTFRKNHPKFPEFLKALKKSGIREGTIVRIAVDQPDGGRIETNVKIQASDLALFEELKFADPGSTVTDPGTDA